MASGGLTGPEYIKHHLTNLTFGRNDQGLWKIAESAEEAKEMGFYAIHIDSMAWAISLGALFIFIFHKVAVRASTGIPGRLQNSIEMVIEFIQSNVKFLSSK